MLGRRGRARSGRCVGAGVRAEAPGMGDAGEPRETHALEELGGGTVGLQSGSLTHWGVEFMVPPI